MFLTREICQSYRNTPLMATHLGYFSANQFHISNIFRGVSPKHFQVCFNNPSQAQLILLVIKFPSSDIAFLDV